MTLFLSYVIVSFPFHICSGKSLHALSPRCLMSDILQFDSSVLDVYLVIDCIDFIEPNFP